MKLDAYQPSIGDNFRRYCPNCGKDVEALLQVARAARELATSIEEAGRWTYGLDRQAWEETLEALKEVEDLL